MLLEKSVVEFWKILNIFGLHLNFRHVNVTLTNITESVGK